MSYSSHDIETSIFGYVPNVGANSFAIAIACILFLYHSWSGVKFRQWWFGTCWSVTMLLELIGYAGRVEAISDINSRRLYEMQSICIIIAPLFMNAGLYYLLAKYIRVHGDRYAAMKPASYSAVFISCDIIALVLQGLGGFLASGRGTSRRSLGKGIMIGGAAFQAATLLIFLVLHALVVRNIRREKYSENFSFQYASIRTRRMFHLLAPFTMLSALFVFVRSIYRVAEFCNGIRGPLIMNEVYFLTLDSLMILLAALPFFVHPGMMLGTSHIPVRSLHRRTEKTIEENYDLYGKEEYSS